MGFFLPGRINTITTTSLLDHLMIAFIHHSAELFIWA